MAKTLNATNQQNGAKPHRPLVAPHGDFSLLLDVCRGLAAFAVLYMHARGLFLVGISSIPAPSPLDKGVAFFVFGHEAVIVFFILSGWLVGGTTLVQQQLNTFSGKHYTLQRVSRIWLVLIPLMLLGLTAQIIYGALETPATSGVLFPELEWGVRHISWETSGPLTFIGNLFGLNTIVVPNYAGNDVLWSLSHEIVFYALIPFWGSAVVAIWQRRARLVWTAIQLGVVVTVIVFLPDYHRFTLLLWSAGALVGAALAYIVTPRKIRLWVKLASWLPLAGALVLTRFQMLSPRLGDLAVALCFLFVLIVYRLAATASIGGTPRREGRIAVAFRTLSAFSFSLYVLHPLVLITFVAVTTGGVRLQPGLRGYGLFALSLVLSLALSWAFAWATEARTQTVRRWLTRILGWGRPPVSGA